MLKSKTLTQWKLEQNKIQTMQLVSESDRHACRNAVEYANENIRTSLTFFSFTQEKSSCISKTVTNAVVSNSLAKNIQSFTNPSQLNRRSPPDG